MYSLVNLPGSNPKVTQMELVKTSGTQRKQKVIDAGIRLVKRGVVRRREDERRCVEDNQSASSMHMGLSEDNVFILYVHEALGRIRRITYTQHGDMFMILALWIKRARSSSITVRPAWLIRSTLKVGRR